MTPEENKQISAPTPTVPEGRSEQPRHPPPRRYVATLYARATAAEKRRIEAKAAGAGVSVSRYLVRAASEDRLPPTGDERVRIEELLYRFKRTSLFLDHFAAGSMGLERAGATAGQQREIREAARALASLAADLRRRL